MSQMQSGQGHLRRIMADLPEGRWRNPRIVSHNDEYRILHTLIATSIADGNLYYYEPDTDTFEPLNLSGDK